MIIRKSVISLVGLFVVFLAQSASAQPRWGRERVPQAGACFYEDIEFRGRYFCVPPGEGLRTVPSGMGDKISSIRVLGSSEVIVYRDSNMRGRSARFGRDVNDLRRGGWNDAISSIDVSGGFRGRDDRGRDDRGNPGNDRGYREGDRGGDRVPVWGRNEPMPRAGACFYEDQNYGGQYFCVARGATYTSLPRGFNDRISSIRVFGSRVRLFQDRDFRGRSTEIRGDTRNLRGKWRDTISSIRVF